MATPSDPPDPIAGAPADEGAPATSDLPPATAERRQATERRAAHAGHGGESADPPREPAAGRASHLPGQATERRRRKRRQRDRAAGAAQAHDRGGPTRLSRRRERIRERRQERQLKEKRVYWAAVRHEVERLKLEAFLHAITVVAQLAFGPSATVMPHLRGKGSRRNLFIVVDAAHPEAITNYDEFLPLEQQFWTAYGTIARPTAAVTVAVRPARGWLRSEGRAPLFTQFGGGGMIS